MIIVKGPLPIADPALDPDKNPDRLVFDAWGVTSPRVHHYRTAEPCILCGAPEGTCTYDDHLQLEAHTAAVEETKEIQRQMNRAPRTVRIQGTTDANTDPSSNLFVVPDDIVEEYIPAGASRPSHRLVHHRGETITKERAAELGLIEVDEVPPAVTAPPVQVSIIEGPAFTPVQD